MWAERQLTPAFLGEDKSDHCFQVRRDPRGGLWVFKRTDLDEVAAVSRCCGSARRGLLPAFCLPGKARVVTAYLAGGSDLFTESRNLGWRAPDLARVFADWAAALAHVHARGFVHRDINLTNLMLTSKDVGTARGVLIDFDTAVPVEYTKALGELFGYDLGVDDSSNRRYFFERYPPEFVQACVAASETEREDDEALRHPSIDVYGLGTMLALTLERTRLGDFEDVGGLRAVADLCTQVAPAGRPAAAELVERLDSLWQ